MTIIFTIISVHGEINGKFARIQPTILTNACLQAFATMIIAFTIIGVCAVRSMGNLSYWLLMKPPQKIFKLWVHIYIILLSFITLYHHVFSKKSSTFAIGVGEVCCHIPTRISLLWLNNFTKNAHILHHEKYYGQ